MKRSISLLLALVMVAGTALPAHARWFQKEIRWSYSRQGPGGSDTEIFIGDTNKALFGGGSNSLDTTNVFSLTDAQPIPRGLIGSTAGGVNNSTGAAGSDTVIAGYLMVQADTTAGTPTGCPSITVVFEGRAAAVGQAVTLARGWTTVDSFTVTQSHTNETIAIPIKTIGTKVHSPMAFEYLRMRTIATNAGAMSGARLFLRYWKDAP